MKNLVSYDDFILESLVLEASQKDITRIQDIVTKSRGDKSKMITLANTMAKVITDKNKAYDRSVAAEQILGGDHEVTKIFMDRASALGVDVAAKSATVQALPGSKRPAAEQYKSSHKFDYGYRGRGAAILPCGSLNLTTGKNKYFNVKENGVSTIEIWKVDTFASSIDEAGSKYKAVITSGSTPIYQIGTKGNFSHDQTGRDLFYGTMVDYIESAHMDALIPLYGKSISCYVYK